MTLSEPVLIPRQNTGVMARYPANPWQEVCVSGDLVPFDEVSVAFRGPMNLHNIAWYEGSADDTSLERTSRWTPE